MTKFLSGFIVGIMAVAAVAFAQQGVIGFTGQLPAGTALGWASRSQINSSVDSQVHITPNNVGSSLGRLTLGNEAVSSPGLVPTAAGGQTQGIIITRGDGTVQTFANLGAATNGAIIYCSDCTIASPCAGGGAGALAKRLNNLWVCN